MSKLVVTLAVAAGRMLLRRAMYGSVHVVLCSQLLYSGPGTYFQPQAATSMRKTKVVSLLRHHAQNGMPVRRQDGKRKQSASIDPATYRTMLQAAGVATGVSGVVYITNQQTVPVTGRSHLILFPSSWESYVGAAAVQATVCLSSGRSRLVLVHANAAKRA